MLSELEETMNTDRKKLTLEYLNAVGNRDYAKLEQMFAPDLQFRGPTLTRSSAVEVCAALKRLSAIHVKNDVKRVFVDGDEVCAIYDFVTDTASGALPSLAPGRHETSIATSLNASHAASRERPSLRITCSSRGSFGPMTLEPARRARSSSPSRTQTLDADRRWS